MFLQRAALHLKAYNLRLLAGRSVAPCQSLFNRNFASNPPKQKIEKPSLVIFDKDGTLISFDKMWTNWAMKFVDNLSQAVHKDVRKTMIDALGYNMQSRRWEAIGILLGTPEEIYERLTDVLVRFGVDRDLARKAVVQCYIGPDQSDPDLVEPLTDLDALLGRLQRNDVRVAICTTDTRNGTIALLQHLDIVDHVDAVLCGDDTEAFPKPDSRNVLHICDSLDIPLAETVMVGDSKDDVTMGNGAGVTTVGVLSGVSLRKDLEEATYILDNVEDLPSIVFPNDPSSASSSGPTSVGSNQKRSFCTSADQRVVPSGTNRKRVFHSVSKVNVGQKRPYHHLAGFQNGASDTVKKSKLLRVNCEHKRSMSSASSGNFDRECDYVIVGAGSAGCVLAHRLTEDPANSVLLLEAGERDTSWKFHMPAALMYTLFDPRYNWCYNTQPQKHMNDRVCYWPRAKVWGGCSSHNAMVYVRGHALDYDRWESEGAEGWSYADCLPYFRKSQTHVMGENAYRGGNGPQFVSRGIMTQKNPLHNAFILAGAQAGYPLTEDMNGYQQEGFGFMDMTIRAGRRWATSDGYLRPILRRRNFMSTCMGHVQRVLFEGKRAVGVQYEFAGTPIKVRARKEVILSAGAINSPQLLMLSGIGPADHLREMGIDVLQDLPGVGQNLQDHLEVYIQRKCTLPITLYKYQWKFPHHMIKAGVQWFLTKTGDCATTHLEAGGFIRSRPGVPHPDLQYHFLPSVVINHGAGLGDCHAFQVHVGPMRPTSRGQLRLKSADPREYILMDPNYLSTPEDREDFRLAVKHTRELFTMQAFDRFRGAEIQPGVDIQSDSQIDAFVRACSDSAYHPSCTARMGRETDPAAVCDPQCRVLGVEGLRVVDASVMPSLVSGNLNGPTIMLAEKAADIIRGKKLLPKSTAAVYQPPTLDTQR